MSGEAMFPHVEVTTSLARLQEAIAAQSRWLEQNGSMLPDGEEDLLAARRMLADELVEEARKLNIGREDHQGHWTDYAESRKSETEIVIIGIQATLDSYELAAILGGGMKIRKVTKAGTETFVAYHHANDATEAMETAATAILNAVNQETVVKRARYKQSLHKHEENRTDRNQSTCHTQPRSPRRQEGGPSGATATTTKKMQARAAGRTGAKANDSGLLIKAPAARTGPTLRRAQHHRGPQRKKCQGGPTQTRKDQGSGQEAYETPGKASKEQGANQYSEWPQAEGQAPTAARSGSFRPDRRVNLLRNDAHRDRGRVHKQKAK
jgi:hypothetical protein